MGKDREHAAAYINLDRYRSGSALARDARLESTNRFLTDVAMRHSAAPDELNVEGTLGRTLAAWEVLSLLQASQSQFSSCFHPCHICKLVTIRRTATLVSADCLSQDETSCEAEAGIPIGFQ